MCIDFKVGPVPSGLEERRIAHQKICELLTKLPLDYYGIKSTSIPKNLLRKSDLATFKKFILSIVNSETLSQFLSTANVGYFTDELREYNMGAWTNHIKYEAKAQKDNLPDYLKEAFVYVMRLEEWFHSARCLLEDEFTYRLVEVDDRAAKEVLIRRFGQNWNDKIALAHYNANVAKELAAEAKKDDGHLDIHFTMG